MINIQGLSKNYGDKQALHNINCQVKEGEIFAILGHNGAGKTTLIKCIMDLISFSGNIDYAFEKKDLYKHISYQMQASVFEEGVRVIELCNLYKKLQKSATDIDELLDEFDLLAFKKSNVNSLSGGEKQKLSILLTLINKPKVIIFDEITTGLDVVARRKVWELIKKVNQDYNTSIILTSHFLEEVEYLADRVLILEKGEEFLTGSVSEIIKQTYGNKKTISFFIANVESAAAVDQDFKKLMKRDNRYIVEYDAEEEIDILEKIRKNDGTDIIINEYSFEDAFLKSLGYVIDEEGGITYGKNDDIY